MVPSEVAGAVVDGVVVRTLVCCVVDSFVGAVAVSVDLIICDIVNGVVDEMSCMSADVDVELIIEMLLVAVGSEEALTRGLEAVDTTRSKTSMKTIRGDIFAIHQLVLF